MKKITSIEIKCLKVILSAYRDEVIELRRENEQLRQQLEESRAKEGKGALENMVDGLRKAISSIDWNRLGNLMCETLPEELEEENQDVDG